MTPPKPKTPSKPITAPKLRQAIAKRIVTLRKEAGYGTQQTFAEALKVTQQWVQRIESGRENPSVIALSRIALTLKIEMADILVGIPADPAKIKD